MQMKDLEDPKKGGAKGPVEDIKKGFLCSAQETPGHICVFV